MLTTRACGRPAKSIFMKSIPVLDRSPEYFISPVTFPRASRRGTDWPIAEGAMFISPTNLREWMDLEPSVGSTSGFPAPLIAGGGGIHRGVARRSHPPVGGRVEGGRQAGQDQQRDQKEKGDCAQVREAADELGDQTDDRYRIGGIGELNVSQHLSGDQSGRFYPSDHEVGQAIGK